MFGVSTIEGIASTVAHDAVIGAKAIESVLKKVEGSVAPALVEGITAVIDPNAVKYEQLAFALLGPCAAAAAAVVDAGSSGFLNVQFDTAMILALKACWVDLQSNLKAKGVLVAPAAKPTASTTK